MITLKFIIITFVLSELMSNLIFPIKHKFPKFIQKYIHILYCEKCLGLWLTLLFTGDIFIAAIVSVVFILKEKIVEYNGKEI